MRPDNLTTNTIAIVIVFATMTGIAFGADCSYRQLPPPPPPTMYEVPEEATVAQPVVVHTVPVVIAPQAVPQQVQNTQVTVINQAPAPQPDVYPVRYRSWNQSPASAHDDDWGPAVASGLFGFAAGAAIAGSQQPYYQQPYYAYPAQEGYYEPGYQSYYPQTYYTQPSYYARPSYYYPRHRYRRRCHIVYDGYGRRYRQCY